MLKKTIICLAVFSLALFSGCINSETIVKVKPDGSGEIHETILFSTAISQMINSMQASLSSSDSSSKSSPLYDEKKLKNEVSKYGEDVVFVSSNKYKTDKGEGYKAIYSFKDINKIKLNQNPGSKVDSNKNVEENMFFEMKPGKISTLKVIMNNSKTFSKSEPDLNESEIGSDSEEKVDSAATQMMMAQMTKMFDGMRIRIAVNVDGDIVETNATHRDKNEITLMDMDFAKLVQDLDAFEKFSKANPKTISETKELIKDVNGIRIDLNEELIIKFK